MAHIVPKLEFSEIFREMLGGDMYMRPPDAVLKTRPKVFERIGMVRAAHPYVPPVVHGAVQSVAFAHEGAISRMFVRAHHRILLDMRMNVREQGGFAIIGHDTGDNIAAALDHTKHDRLRLHRRAALLAFP